MNGAFSELLGPAATKPAAPASRMSTAKPLGGGGGGGGGAFSAPEGGGSGGSGGRMMGGRMSGRMDSNAASTSNVRACMVGSGSGSRESLPSQ